MPRDVEILTALGSYRFLSVPQAAALFFPSPAAAQARLHQLAKQGLALRVFMPVRPYDRTAHTIYALSARGAREVAARQEGVRPRHLTSREHRSGLFLDHTLRRNDLRVCLERLTTMGDLELLYWRQAPDEVGMAAEVHDRGRTVRVPAVPDGVAAFRRAGAIEVFIVEIDMGTVKRESMALRYRAYWRLSQDGTLRRRFGPVPIRVLTLTTTPLRREALRRGAVLAPDNGRKGSGLFWFGLVEQADLGNPARLLDSSWYVATALPTPPRALFHPL
jgi:hypothetical protein